MNRSTAIGLVIVCPPLSLSAHAQEEIADQQGRTAAVSHSGQPGEDE